MSDPTKSACGMWGNAHGLFVNVDTPAGKLDLRYVGEYKTVQEHNKQADEDCGNEDKYLYTADFDGSLNGLGDLTIDATSVRGIGRYINDYRTNISDGCFNNSRLQTRKPNVEFLQVVHKKDVHITALQDFCLRIPRPR